MATTPAGYDELIRFAASFGEVATWGLEGTGSYGLGLARHLRKLGYAVVEVDRPSRQSRHRLGKSDPTDARAAALAVLAGRCGEPKTAEGLVEAVRILKVARDGAQQARKAALATLRSLVVTAPDELRQALRDKKRLQLHKAALKLRPGEVTDPASATKVALKSLARRIADLDGEIAKIDEMLAGIVPELAPAVVALIGIGIDGAATFLMAAGDNPGRLRSESAFAKLCGSSPLPASSGKVVRHRLNRGGNRQANAALHRAVLVRLRWHERTRAYMARRTAEGKSKKEIIRCLKRYVAREVYHALVPTPVAKSEEEPMRDAA